MRGLLVKDFRLLSNQKQFFLTILVIALMFAVAGQDVIFIISYCTMVGSFFTISTISYDEFNHGFAFLFTMPITRKGYVAEKYLFGFLMGGGIWFVMTGLGALYSWMKEPGMNMAEWLAAATTVFLVLGGILFVMIPLQLRFGAEKSRIATAIFMLICFAFLMLISKAGESIGVSPWNLDWIYSIGMAGWLFIGAAAFVAAGCVSLAVSIRIVEKKQF